MQQHTCNKQFNFQQIKRNPKGNCKCNTSFPPPLPFQEVGNIAGGKEWSMDRTGKYETQFGAVLKCHAKVVLNVNPNVFPYL